MRWPPYARCNSTKEGTPTGTTATSSPSWRPSRIPGLRRAYAAIRRWQPAVLFTHDPAHPFPPYTTHRDHRIVGRAALDASYPLARDHLSFPEHAREGLTAHAVRQVWLFSSERPTAHVDISAGFDRKIAARLAHESQTGDPRALHSGWRERAARIGTEAGLPLDEAFVVLHLE